MRTANPTTRARVVYESPSKRIIVKRIAAGDFTLELDGYYHSSHRSQAAAEVEGGRWLHSQVDAALSTLEAALA